MSRILRSSASLSAAAAVSGLEVVVEGVGQAVPAPSSASRLTGVFWSVFLPCSSAQRLWKETSPSASLPTSFFVLAMVFCSSWLCFFLLVAVSASHLRLVCASDRRDLNSRGSSQAQ